MNLREGVFSSQFDSQTKERDGKLAELRESHLVELKQKENEEAMRMKEMQEEERARLEKLQKEKEDEIRKYVLYTLLRESLLFNS